LAYIDDDNEISPFPVINLHPMEGKVDSRSAGQQVGWQITLKRLFVFMA
jgi:hypothetical protein